MLVHADPPKGHGPAIIEFLSQNSKANEPHE